MYRSKTPITNLGRNFAQLSDQRELHGFQIHCLYLPIFPDMGETSPSPPRITKKYTYFDVLMTPGEILPSSASSTNCIGQKHQSVIVGEISSHPPPVVSLLVLCLIGCPLPHCHSKCLMRKRSWDGVHRVGIHLTVLFAIVPPAGRNFAQAPEFHDFEPGII